MKHKFSCTPRPCMAVIGVFFILLFCSPILAQSTYFPPPGLGWQKRTPAAAGFDQIKLDQAIQFAKDNESPTPKNLEVAHYQSFGREPFGNGIGPFKERGEATGIIIRNGYIVAEWGDPLRVDMTFSVTKSFLSTVVGVAFDKGLIQSVDDKVYPYMAPIVFFDQKSGDRSEKIGESQILDLFYTEHNRKITWNHLLRQVSDWQGVLWGKPEWADRPTGEPNTWTTRPRNEPGTVYEYNDTRVNVLALATANLLRQPLPQVLKESIMDPIGASASWRWIGYDNSWIVMDGQVIQAVGGGGHWGGGMFINAHDMARFGLLTLNRGKWNGQQLLSEKWITMARTPTPANTGYGFMNWFLNTDKKMLPSAPASAVCHLGNGTNMVYIDPEHDLVIVARWIKNSEMDGLVSRVIGALK